MLQGRFADIRECEYGPLDFVENQTIFRELGASDVADSKQCAGHLQASSCKSESINRYRYHGKPLWTPQKLPKHSILKRPIECLSLLYRYEICCNIHGELEFAGSNVRRHCPIMAHHFLRSCRGKEDQ